MKGTFVLIPAYNEERTIGSVIQKVSTATPDRIICIDDGSDDGTAGKVQGLIDAGHLPCNLELLRHGINQGKGMALTTGFVRALASGAERVVTIDGDGQHDGFDLQRLEQVAIRDSNAVIIAARLQERHQAPPLRRFANKVADFWISWACGQRIQDTQSGFRLYPAAVLLKMTEAMRIKDFAFETGLLIDAVRAGARVRMISITTRYSVEGRASHYRPWLDTWSIIRLVGAELLRRRMYLSGLVCALRSDPRIDSVTGQSLHEGE